MTVSETSLCRHRLARFCRGSGLDLGCGGDLVVPHAIGVDQSKPYNLVGDQPIHLRGDARVLEWFTDGCLDFVFSSHLLEDFPAEQTEAVLREWARVLRSCGHLVLYGPDEVIYRQHCKETGQNYNASHSVGSFGAAYVASVIRRIACLELTHRRDHCEVYSFELVARKV